MCTTISSPCGKVLFCFDLSGNPGKLQQLANLPLDASLWVQIGKTDELAEAELKYVGPLTRGSTAIIFGVQLKVRLNQGCHHTVDFKGKNLLRLLMQIHDIKHN